MLAEEAQLNGADGIALDTAGDLYIAVNDSNRLYRLSPADGSLTRLADRSDRLSYPTQPAFDTNARSTTLHLTTGAFMNGVADIEAFDATGLPLPDDAAYGRRVSGERLPVGHAHRTAWRAGLSQVLAGRRFPSAALGRRVAPVDAGQVAGLLVLLGVVGVLTAIVGSGIEAGPVKFPSIPGSRQKPLALASALVAAGGVAWWAIQQQGDGIETAQSVATRAPPTAKLRLSLIPAASSIRVGNRVVIRAEVYNSLGQQLGRGQCQLDWSDSATNWSATTPCIATASEPSATKPGTHRFTARAQGLGGLLAQGSGTVEVTVHRKPR